MEIQSRPIIFSGPMVRAILDGNKTQTRRIVENVQGDGIRHEKGYYSPLPTCDRIRAAHWTGPSSSFRLCPYGLSGDHLWVRETHSWITLAENEWDGADDQRRHPDGYPVQMLYRADGIWGNCPIGSVPWSPSIHMFRWASRITLEITDVRVQRIHGISEEDAIAEGIKPLGRDEMDCRYWLNYETNEPTDCPLESYATLWDSLYAAKGYGWDTNVWVWAVTFRRIE